MLARLRQAEEALMRHLLPPAAIEAAAATSRDSRRFLMAQRFALPVLATVALTALFGSPTLPAAGGVAKPGTIVTVAGNGTPGYSGDNGPAIRAQLHWCTGLAFDDADNLYIADWYNDRVRKVSPEGTITTVAGTGQWGFSGDGGKATDAQLNGPLYVAVDGGGNLFISDFFNHRVRKVAPDGIISTYAGSGPVELNTNARTPGPMKGGFSGDNGPATDARLDGPIGLAVDALGDLFIMDHYNYRVRKVSPEGTITTVAGTGVNRFSGDGGLATEAGVTYAWALAVDAFGDLFIAEHGSLDPSVANHRIRKVTPDGIIRTIAGAGKGGFSGDGGPATDARLNSVIGLAVDSVGNLFLSDWGNYRVRKVDSQGLITTIAGIGKQPYAGDGGLATETVLRGPSGLAIDAAGNLLIADTSGEFHDSDGLPHSDRILKVFGAAAAGLVAGKTFPQ
jgi:sugar lactone lactonase YvrE